ncbi:hypothetical protein BDN70DRAFT_529933 [Pholiota conissans]|uniref:Uncharacterized protein n=1 Tax=Pholiota conissans TaxID=109636 RepID=A0A9P6CVA0_9AGAR|nr:hypothetical protein BDN70DRAFT_529933 [Pholiota conissans]
MLSKVPSVKMTVIFFEYKGFAPRLTRGYPTLLANWLPFIRIKDRKTNYGHDIYYLKSVDNQWKDEFGALEDEESQSKWLFRTLESRYAIQKHAHACAFWEKVYSRRQNVTQDWMQRVFERFKMAEDPVKKIGIEEDLLKLPPAESDIPDQTCDRILESCDLPWTVSEGYLSSLKHDLGSRTCVQYLNKLRKYLEYEELHRSRMRILSGIYNSALHRVSLDVPFPSLGQAFRIIEDHDLLDYSEEILRVSFEEVVSLWRKHVERELVELVAAVVEHPVTKAVDLNLATTMFICPNESSCPTNTMLRPNQAMVHPCVQAVEPYLIPALSGWTPADTFRSQFGAVAWCDGSGGVRFSKADFLVLEGVVKMLGLDPQVTTSRQMDELDSILECRACNSFEEGRAALSWAAVPGHQRKAHNGSSDIHALTVLEEPEATYVRKRIKEEQATSYQLKTDCEVICMHCNSLILGLGVYREHLKEAHHIFDYNGEEVVYSVHENQIPPLYRL